MNIKFDWKTNPNHPHAEKSTLLIKKNLQNSSPRSRVGLIRIELFLQTLLTALQSCLRKRKTVSSASVWTTVRSTSKQFLMLILCQELTSFCNECVVLGVFRGKIWGMGTTSCPLLKRISTKQRSRADMACFNSLSWPLGSWTHQVRSNVSWIKCFLIYLMIAS